MKIGDKVRLLKGTEEGIIVSIKKDKIVEVEIEDGFVIPALINEVVVIDRKEREAFGQSTQDETEAANDELQPEILPGIHLAISEEEAGTFHGYLINQTDDTVLFSISIQLKKTITGLSSGIIDRRSLVDFGKLKLELINKGQQIITHLILHEKETRFKKQPISSTITLNHSMLKKKAFVSSIGNEAILLRIDGEPIEAIDPGKLKERLVEGNIYPSLRREKVKAAGEHTIDLHVDADDPSLNTDQILKFQIDKFEKAYDEALLMNLEKLKVIHGVGAGILRDAIHKRLSKKEEVKYFEDGDKERFGFGSTIIYF